MASFPPGNTSTGCGQTAENLFQNYGQQTEEVSEMLPHVSRAHSFKSVFQGKIDNVIKDHLKKM